MNLSKLWAEILAETGLVENRPAYDFDPVFYGARYPDLVEAGINLREHYRKSGKKEGRLATAYHVTKEAMPDLDRRISELVVDEQLRTAIQTKQPGAFEFAFELIALGDPIDRIVSDFSEAHYYTRYPDVKAAGIPAVQHYVRFGQDEGRKSLAGIRRDRTQGDKPFDDDKPTCILCVHEFSRSGAPIVGLDVARQAAETHNVIVMGLTGGPLLDLYQEHACSIYLTQQPNEDLDFLDLPDPTEIDFAIINSVESWAFARYFVRRSIPFVNYIHEFTEYIPVGRAVWGSLFSDLVVFGSDIVRNSWKSIFADMNFDVERDSVVVPHRELWEGKTEGDEKDAARARISKLIGQECKDRRIVYGVGNVEWRKGVDLFVLTAQLARKQDPDAIFIWIGDGRNHEDMNFGVWLEKHLLEAEADTPDGNLFFLPAGDYYQDLCKAADVMYLPSRLDSLPNAVFEAVEFNGRVVLFRHATGFDEDSYAAHGNIESVQYGNLVEACDAILSAPRASEEKFDPWGGRDSATPPDIFERIAGAFYDRQSSQRYFVAGTGDYDLPMLYSTREEDRDARLQEREKMWSYGRRWLWRSPLHAMSEIKASDNWMHQNVRVDRFAWVDQSPLPKYSIHIHAHYLDNLGGDLLYYRALQEASRIVVTTGTNDKVEQIKHISENAGVPVEALKMPNQGRDILPFMRLFSEGHASEDEIWCHVHLKKSPDLVTVGEIWRRFLMTILMGDDKRLSSALELISQPDIGLVTSFDPASADWNSSRRLLPQLEPRLPGPFPEHILLFPIGNMFWTRGSVVAKMNGIFGDDYPWPNEPIPNDGTVFHLIERLWPAACAIAGKGSVYLDKPDQKRM